MEEQTESFVAVSLPQLVEQREKRVYCWIKRGFDITVSLICLLLLSPVMLLLGILILLDDPSGSPIFKQKRVGKDGKIFWFYKFRSMVRNAEELQDQLQEKNEKDGPVFKMKEDPRVTRIGKWMRKTSLDELPQLWNVLAGDMSLVGPRPPLPKEVAQYDEKQKQRLSVIPGMTCYWQIQPNRDAIEFQKWVEMDLKYIRERGILTDLKILFCTAYVVLTGQGE